MHHQQMNLRKLAAVSDGSTRVSDLAAVSILRPTSAGYITKGDRYAGKQKACPGQIQRPEDSPGESPI